MPELLLIQFGESASASQVWKILYSLFILSNTSSTAGTGNVSKLRVVPIFPHGL